DVCQSTAVFMPLVEKVMAVVVTGSWAARIGRENISVLIGLGVGAVGQEPELGDLGRWVFQGVSSKCDSYQFEPSGDHGVRRVHALIGGRNGVFDRPDPALAEGKGGGKNEAERDPQASMHQHVVAPHRNGWRFRNDTGWRRVAAGSFNNVSLLLKVGKLEGTSGGFPQRYGLLEDVGTLCEAPRAVI